MQELTTANMPNKLITSADSISRAIPAIIELITDPAARSTVRYDAMSATITSDLILIEADYDGYTAHVSLRLVNGTWNCSEAIADNPAMRALVLSVTASLTNDGIIAGAEYSVIVNRLYATSEA